MIGVDPRTGRPGVSRRRARLGREHVYAIATVDPLEERRSWEQHAGFASLTSLRKGRRLARAIFNRREYLCLRPWDGGATPKSSERSRLAEIRFDERTAA